MTLNRLITTMVQLGLAIPAFYGIKFIFQDIKTNGFLSDHSDKIEQ